MSVPFDCSASSRISVISSPSADVRRLGTPWLSSTTQSGVAAASPRARARRRHGERDRLGLHDVVQRRRRQLHLEHRPAAHAQHEVGAVGREDGVEAAVAALRRLEALDELERHRRVGRRRDAVEVRRADAAELLDVPGVAGEGDDEVVRLDLGEVHLRALGERLAAQHGGARRRHQLERGGRAQHLRRLDGGARHDDADRPRYVSIWYAGSFGRSTRTIRDVSRVRCAWLSAGATIAFQPPLSLPLETRPRRSSAVSADAPPTAGTKLSAVSTRTSDGGRASATRRAVECVLERRLVARAVEHRPLHLDAARPDPQQRADGGRVARADELGDERDAHHLVLPDVEGRPPVDHLAHRRQRDPRRRVVDARDDERALDDVVPPRVDVGRVREVGAERDVPREGPQVGRLLGRRRRADRRDAARRARRGASS